MAWAFLLAGCAVPGGAPAPVEQRAAGTAAAVESRTPVAAGDVASAAPVPGPAAAPVSAAAPSPAPAPPPPPGPTIGLASSEPAPAAPAASGRGPLAAGTKARWTLAAWSELPGFEADRSAEVWPALVAGCARPAPGWNELCARALLDPPRGHEAVRRWLVAHLQPWRIESAGPGAAAEGLATGYFEPSLEAQRRPRGNFRVPLYAAPAELATRKPFYTRQQLDSLPAAMATVRGLEIAWLDDPLDGLLLQVQGSGRVRITEPDGRVSLVRLAYAAHNEQPYRSLGRWLIEQGELSADAASWPGIKAWAQKNPRRLQELLWVNPRVIFFREEPLPDPSLGPRGAQGVPLTPGRSVAVDPQALPHGTLLWLDTTEPLSATPLRRLVMAQDSGSAIVGAVRVDLFFGWSREAEALAGRMKQPLRLWALWPRGAAPLDAP